MLAIAAGLTAGGHVRVQRLLDRGVRRRHLVLGDLPRLHRVDGRGRHPLPRSGRLRRRRRLRRRSPGHRGQPPAPAGRRHRRPGRHGVRHHHRPDGHAPRSGRVRPRHAGLRALLREVRLQRAVPRATVRRALSGVQDVRPAVRRRARSSSGRWCSPSWPPYSRGRGTVGSDDSAPRCGATPSRARASASTSAARGVGDLRRRVRHRRPGRRARRHPAGRRRHLRLRLRSSGCCGWPSW